MELGYASADYSGNKAAAPRATGCSPCLANADQRGWGWYKDLKEESPGVHRTCFWRGEGRGGEGGREKLRSPGS